MNFNNMKNKMDQGGFGEIHFTEKEKDKVLNTINNKAIGKTKHPFRDFLSLAACFILVIGLSYLSFGTQIKKDSMPIEQKNAETETTTQQVPIVSQTELDQAAQNFDQIGSKR